MLLETRHFGEVEYNEAAVFSFECGLPGFENAKKFFILDTTNEDSPFKWLQSVDVSSLAFAVVNPFLIVPDYDFELGEEDVAKLGIEDAEDVAVYTILVVPENPDKISMNLKAPVIINAKNKKAAQIVLDTDKYTVRHYILDELGRQGVVADAGADKKKGSNDNNK